MKIVSKHVTGKVVIISLIAAYSVYLLMILITIPTTSEFANGMDLLDMKPLGYSTEYVHQLLEQLGESGRHYYLTHQLPLDFIYPALFALSGYLTLVYLFKKTHFEHTNWSMLKWVPILAGTADYFENFGIIYLLKTYPEINSIASTLTASFSITKSMSTTVYFSTLILILGFIAVQHYRVPKKCL